MFCGAGRGYSETRGPQAERRRRRAHTDITSIVILTAGTTQRSTKRSLRLRGEIFLLRGAQSRLAIPDAAVLRGVDERAMSFAPSISTTPSSSSTPASSASPSDGVEHADHLEVAERVANPVDRRGLCLEHQRRLRSTPRRRRHRRRSTVRRRADDRRRSRLPPLPFAPPIFGATTCSRAPAFSTAARSAATNAGSVPSLTSTPTLRPSSVLGAFSIRLSAGDGFMSIGARAGVIVSACPSMPSPSSTRAHRSRIDVLEVPEHPLADGRSSTPCSART